jgi:threonine/homoserine/homoserine lactone efflux protein
LGAAGVADGVRVADSLGWKTGWRKRVEYFGVLMTICGALALAIMSPGANFALVTSVALGASRRAGVMTGLGLALASFTWALLAVAGLGLVLRNLPWLHNALRWAGALYLVYLGMHMLEGARRPVKVVSQGEPVSALWALRRGYLVSMTNPKAVAFYGCILALLIPPRAPQWVYGATVTLAALISAGWYCGVALLLSHAAVRQRFLRAKTVIEAALGLSLLLLGGRLLTGH